MLNILRFELRKIYRSRINLAIFLVATLAVIMSFFWEIIEYGVETPDGEISGLPVLSYLIEEDKTTKTKMLDDENIKEALDKLRAGVIVYGSGDIKKILNKETYKEIYLPNSEYYWNISEIYYPSFSNIQVGFSELLSGKEKRNLNEAYEDMLKLLYKSWRLPNRDIKFFEDYAKKVSPPIKTGATFGYEKFLNFIRKLSTLAFAVALVLAGTFSHDFESASYKMLYSAKYGRKKAILGKVIAGFIVGISTFIISISMGYLMINFSIGFKNGDLPVQSLDMSSLMPFTIKELAIREITLCLLLFIFIAGLSMAFSAFSKNSYATTGFIFLFYALDLMYPYNGNVTLFGKLYDLAPFRICDNQFASLRVYRIFNFEGDFFEFAPMLYIFMILILYAFSILRYRKGSLKGR